MRRRSSIETLYELLAKRKRRRKLRPSVQVAESNEFEAGLLERLVGYYLACLRYYQPLQYSFRADDYHLYHELDESPIGSSDQDGYASAVEGLLRYSGHLTGGGQRLELCYSDLVVVEIKIVNAERVNVVHPLILYPYRQFDDEVGIDWAMPIVNSAGLAVFDGIDEAAAAAEAEELTAELRRVAAEDEMSASEVVFEYRPDWQLVQEAGRVRRQLARVAGGGLYQRHTLCLVENSPYTRSLEQELSLLPGLEGVGETALGAVLSSVSGVDEESDSVKKPEVLSVLESNLEQGSAVEAALRDRLVVIQGPPGTGKSQVIAQTIINAVHDGQTVLFVSKNNQAVDVVERRINKLSTRPILFRVGPGRVKSQIAGYLRAHLDPPEFKSVDRMRLAALISRLRRAEGRSQGRLESYSEGRSRAVELEAVVDSGDPREFESLPTWMVSRLWSLLDRDARLDKGADWWSRVPERLVLDSLLQVARVWGVRVGGLSDDADLRQELLERVEVESNLRELTRIKRGLSRSSLVDRVRVSNVYRSRLVKQGGIYWPVYVSLRLSRLRREVRQGVVDMMAYLRLGWSSPDSIFDLMRLGPGSSPIPAWATTLLSLRRSMPLESGLFDVVIFDEASQCDIASALPALARARRAVVIGDPKQLPHITPHGLMHEKVLLQSYGLSSKLARWGYTNNSLFDLLQSSVPLSQVKLLRDHHRSHPDVVEFSNQHFYGGLLRVKTNQSKLRLSPDLCGVAWSDTGSTRLERPAGGSALNVKEAKSVLREIERVLGYDAEVSIGVVTPFRAQAEYIERMIIKDLGDYLITTGRIKVGTVHTFQGDERDVVVFSPVVAEGITEGQIRFISAAGNLFNVAITRAKSRFVVVGDLVYARASQTPFYTSFAEYIVKLNRPKPKHELKLVTPSREMKTLLSLASQSLLDASDLDRLDRSVFSWPEFKIAGFEVVSLEVGLGKLVVLLDRFEAVTSSRDFDELVDFISSRLEDGSEVLAAARFELEGLLDLVEARARRAVEALVRSLSD